MGKQRSKEKDNQKVSDKSDEKPKIAKPKSDFTDLFGTPIKKEVKKERDRESRDSSRKDDKEKERKEKEKEPSKYDDMKRESDCNVSVKTEKDNSSIKHSPK